MQSLFDPEGILSRAMEKISDLIFLNVTFVIVSLPLITIGAALTALYDCTFDMLDDKEEAWIHKQFLKSFRRHFKSSTGAWLITLAVILFFAAYTRGIGLLTGNQIRMYQIIEKSLIILFSLVLPYVFLLLARTEQTALSAWKEAVRMVILTFPWAIINLVLLAGLTAIFTILLPGGVSIYLWGFFFFALLIFFSSMLLKRALKNHVE